MTTGFHVLPLSALHESPHNPRRHFNKAQLKQLADSVATVGFLTPLLVRPNKNGYEIAAGHRRYRAGKMAKITEAPCVVRELTDEQFMEILTIENLQREDVHPLDEATGYEALMAAPYKMKVERIAERVGKSVKYIYDRVKLLMLCPAARQFFWDGKIESGHAILLARLSPAEQAKVIGDKLADYANGGLFQIEHLLYDEEAEQDSGDPMKAVSVRELADYIKRHVRFNAKNVDSFLLPDTAEKLEQAEESDLKIVEITYDYLASDAVRSADRSARVLGEKAWKRADGKDGSKTCDRSVMGVVAAGTGQGQAFLVCANKDRCEVHWGKQIRARQKRRNERESGTRTSAKPKVDTLEQQREREENERARWAAAVPAMRKALAERIRKASVKVDGYLVTALIEELAAYCATPAETNMVSIGKTADDTIRHLGWLHLAQYLDYGSDRGTKVMKAFGLDPKKFLAKKESKQPVQTSAQPKTKKKGKAA